MKELAASRNGGEFRGSGGTALYYQAWTAPNPPARIIIAHGLGDHGGRYFNLINHFTPLGCSFYAFDYRGHGKSPGRRAYISRFEDLAEDLKIFIEFVQKDAPAAPAILLGHSMGATLAAFYAASRTSGLDGLVLSAPVITPGSSVTPVKIALAMVLSALAPRAGVTTIDSSAISRDPAVVAAYDSDPLVYRGRISAKTGAELLRITRILPEMLAQIKLPVLILHGESDRLSDPASSRLLYERVGSNDRTLKLYPGLFHEIFNEPEREVVFADMAHWLDSHVKTGKKLPAVDSKG